MTTAVLKNRILQATARTFNERDYGADSFTALIRQLPELVDVDESVRPPSVTLLEAKSAGVDPDRLKAVPGRLRPDLWDAVLDYSSGKIYVWDGSSAIDVDSEDGGDWLRMPTISAEVMTEWRREFARDHVDDGLGEWAVRNLGTRALPPALRKPWNQTIKSKVLEILDRWFTEHDLALPDDVVEGGAEDQKVVENHEAEELRRFLLRCVAVMKPSELRAVQVPVAVALRARV